MKQSIILIFVFFSGLFFFNDTRAALPDSICQVHIINIGQGDATLLEFSCGAILIDAGAQSNKYVDSLIIYLEDFFAERDYLNNTLESVMITHDDQDHRLGLREVMEAFEVKRIIYNGNTGSSGDLAWAIKNPDLHDAELFPVSFEMITAGNNSGGLTNDDIDPISCGSFDPQIILLSGGFENKPAGWTKEAYNKGNNHSLVIRLDLGEASFIFTGDLELKGINTLIDYYSDLGNASIFDVDVYHVGHHGSHNATSEELLALLTPEISVISVGPWDYGKYSGSTMTTYRYGHPRRVVVSMLEDYMPDNRRSKSIRAKLASKPKKFRKRRIKQKIYATPWDGNIRIKATSGGDYTVYRKR